MTKPPVEWRSAFEWRRLVASEYCTLIPSHRYVCTVLSYWANRQGEAYPSQLLIAQRAGVHRKTVITATERACSLHWLIREQAGTGQGYKHYCYQLTLPWNVATEMELNPDAMKQLLENPKPRFCAVEVVQLADYR